MPVASPSSGLMSVRPRDLLPGNNRRQPDIPALLWWPCLSFSHSHRRSLHGYSALKLCYALARIPPRAFTPSCLCCDHELSNTTPLYPRLSRSVPRRRCRSDVSLNGLLTVRRRVFCPRPFHAVPFAHISCDWTTCALLLVPNFAATDSGRHQSHRAS